MQKIDQKKQSRDIFRDRKIWWFLLFLVLLFVLIFSSKMHGWLESFVEIFEEILSVYPVLSGVLFVILSAFAVFFFFFSSVIFLPSAILAWGEGVTFVLLWAGWVLGGMFTYGIGRWLGKSAIYHFVEREKFDRYTGFVRSDLPFWLVGLFTITVPAEVPGYLFGMARYTWWKFLAAITLAELPFVILAVYAGDTFLEGKYFMLIIAVVLVLIIAAMLSRRIHKKYIEK